MGRKCEPRQPQFQTYRGVSTGVMSGAVTSVQTSCRGPQGDPGEEGADQPGFSAEALAGCLTSCR